MGWAWLGGWRKTKQGRGGVMKNGSVPESALHPSPLGQIVYHLFL